MKSFKSVLLPVLILLLILICPFGFAGAQNDKSAATGARQVVNVTESMGNQTMKDMWSKVKIDFEKKYSGYDLQFEAVNDMGPEQFYKVKIAADEFPAVAKIWQPALLINSGVVREIPKELQDLMKDPRSAAVGGKVYTLQQMVGYLGYFYNKNIFKKAGVTTLPSDWAEFMSALKKIKALGIAPLGMAVSEGGFVNGYFNFLWAPVTYGPQPNWPALRTQGKVKYNNPITRRTMERFVETVPYFQEGANSAKYDQVLSMFMNQETAIWIGGIYNVPAFESGELKPDFEIGYLTPPQDKPEERRVNYYGDNLYVINSKIKGSELQGAIDYLKFFFSTQTYPVYLNAIAGFPTAKGFESFSLTFNNPIAKVMGAEIVAAANKYGIVAHAHAAMGDNMWPEGTREMAEKIDQEIAAGNRDYNALMDLFDNQWDIGVQQAKSK
jgi:ABC-type glycerol-3-phosphate transport system substrate-binding protein